MARMQSTNHRFALVDINLARNVFYGYILLEENVRFVVYSALRLRLACFAACSVVNVGKVRECHRYVIYIQIVFSNNCPSKII
jgi:hypothetical protein